MASEQKHTRSASHIAEVAASSGAVKGGQRLSVRAIGAAIAVLAVGATGYFVVLGNGGTLNFIQPANAETATSATAAKSEPAKPAAGAQIAAAPQAAAPSALPKPLLQFTQQLQDGGVHKCLGLTQGMGAFALNGAAEYASASMWNQKQPDQRLMSAVVGQKFAVPQGSADLHGVSAVMAAPTADGKCDGASVQIVPSALSCQQLQATVMAKGKQLAMLAGLPFLEDANSQRMMLLPTAGNGCVIIGFNNVYAE